MVQTKLFSDLYFNKTVFSPIKFLRRIRNLSVTWFLQSVSFNSLRPHTLITIKRVLIIRSVGH